MGAQAFKLRALTDPTLVLPPYSFVSDGGSGNYSWLRLGNSLDPTRRICEHDAGVHAPLTSLEL
jgi:hypothetical protein